MKWPHWHSDPNWQANGVHYYEQCRCGARRVTYAYRNIVGPTRLGWPSLMDRHGVMRNSSGWVFEPAEGWPTEDVEPFRPPPMRPSGGRR